MFSEKVEQENETVEQQPPASTKKEYIPMTFEQNQIQNSMKMSSLDNLLELEKQQNKSDHWNKLDKTRRIQLLHAFAETYCREKELAMRDMKTLKLYFNDCLDKGKLVKTKDVIYNREKGIIESIPGLFFNPDKRQFVVRSTDGKRVSTLKSLTPKRAVSE
jgi:hypothetical protein